MVEIIKGFVLGVTRFRESSAVVSIFSLEHGRFSGMAKGAFRKGSSFAGALEPFALCEFTASFHKGREMQLVTACTLDHYYRRVREDLGRLLAAETALELVRKTVHEGEPLPSLFLLLQSYLERLEKTSPAPKSWLCDMAWLFLLHYLKIMGFGPQFRGCVRCGEVTIKGRVAVSAVHGGVLCPSCGLGITDVRWMTVAEVERMARLYASKADQLAALPPADLFLTEDLLRDFLSVHFEKNLTLDSLKELYRLDAKESEYGTGGTGHI